MFRGMDRRFASAKSDEKKYALGKFYVIFDYLFIFFILFRISVINDVFYMEVNDHYRHRDGDFYFMYLINMFTFPYFVIFFCMIIQNLKKVKEKFSDWKTTRFWSLVTFSFPVAIALIVSYFFYDSIEVLLVKFPEEYRHNIIPSYYLTYIYTLMYSIVRAILVFDYYKSYYLKSKRDYLYVISLFYYLFLSIVINFILPKEWLYMFF